MHDSRYSQYAVGCWRPYPVTYVGLHYLQYGTPICCARGELLP